MNTQIILMLGAPGCGKGYLAQCIINHLVSNGMFKPKDINVISTGDLLRAEIKEETELGIEIKNILESGKFVSDEIVQKLLAKALSKNVAVTFIDGYPRNMAQLETFRALVHEMNVIPIFRDTPIEIILERTAQRRICRLCGTTHSVNDGKCPKCSGESIVRKDDAVINERIKTFEKYTLPAIKEINREFNNTFLYVNGRLDAKKSVKKILKYLFFHLS